MFIVKMVEEDAQKNAEDITPETPVTPETPAEGSPEAPPEATPSSDEETAEPANADL